MATGDKRDSWQAVTDLNTTALRTLVSTLGQKGVRVLREPFAFEVRHGKTVRAKKYWVEPAERTRVRGGKQ